MTIAEIGFPASSFFSDHTHLPILLLGLTGACYPPCMVSHAAWSHGTVSHTHLPYLPDATGRNDETKRTTNARNPEKAAPRKTPPSAERSSSTRGGTGGPLGASPGLARLEFAHVPNLDEAVLVAGEECVPVAAHLAAQPAVGR